jgi:hypothetical protein
MLMNNEMEIDGMKKIENYERKTYSIADPMMAPKNDGATTNTSRETHILRYNPPSWVEGMSRERKPKELHAVLGPAMGDEMDAGHRTTPHPHSCSIFAAAARRLEESRASCLVVQA